MVRFGRTRIVFYVGSLLALLLAAGCGSGATASGTSSSAVTGSNTATTSITLYTSVTQSTVDAVLAAFHTKSPNVKVNVFRAATGALNARIATDKRSGGLGADVLWVSDPLTMHGYDAQGLLQKYSPPSATDLPSQYREPSFAGAGLLYVVLVYHNGLAPVPSSWASLTSASYQKEVAIPDPAFAGSAMGALGYFGEQKAFGLKFFQQLKANGAVQVQSPEDVITGVAQGRYKLGLTIADSALADIKKGSPITVAWPAGAIAIYSPIGVTATTKHQAAARSFDDFVLSRPGQQAIASTGRQPSLAGVPGIAKPDGVAVASPDWSAVFTDQAELLAGYQKIFGS